MKSILEWLKITCVELANRTERGDCAYPNCKDKIASSSGFLCEVHDEEFKKWRESEE